MAEKRMFSNKITQSDPFLSMPASAQNLYFHLAMDADDDGFVNRPKAIMRMVNANEDDMSILVARKFIIPLTSSIFFIDLQNFKRLFISK